MFQDDSQIKCAYGWWSKANLVISSAYTHRNMFKTVKVGDTSLQYTIVSQTDEPTSTCASTAAATIHKSRTKRKTRYRKTVILILITLIMGCGIVIAAVLVPILVANKLVGNLPESAKFQTFAIAASSIQGYGKYDRNGHKYVELLPIRQHPPVESIIEFQDEIQVEKNEANLPTTETFHARSTRHEVTNLSTKTAITESTTQATEFGNSTSSINVNKTTTVLLLLKYLSPRN